MSQQALAEKLESTKRSVINWEGGAALPGAEVLSRYAVAGADVLYVITGERSSAQPAADAAEQVLLDSYRRCGAQARQHLIQTAALLAAGVAPEPRAKSAATGGGMHMSNLGDGNVQIGGAVTGGVRVKKGK